ncbi:MAG: hypothetical protein JO345_31890 [Streptosporangiaceae bacterium]|nr:hypothetical protein [Streptosporangiaceae bacterium]
MADAWMPGARCIRAGIDGGQMQGGAPRVVWLTLGADPRAVSVTSASQRLNTENRPCHVVWDPLTGDIAQLLPIVRAARALGTRENITYVPDDCGHPMPSVNREGRLCVQIGVLGSPREPFTSCPMIGLSDILGWLDSWQIPRRWPAGQPAPYRQADRPRSRALWARGGHYGASQVPDCTSIGPGSIDIDQLIGTDSVMRPPPEHSRPPMAIPLSQRSARAGRDMAAATASLTAAGV